MVEVACFKSSFPDVTGTGEGEQKERTPKGYTPVGILLGHKVKNLMTVIGIRWGAIRL